MKVGEAIAHLHFLWRAGRARRTLDAEGIYVFQRAAKVMAVQAAGD